LLKFNDSKLILNQSFKFKNTLFMSFMNNVWLGSEMRVPVSQQIQLDDISYPS
jgi:hypothetical protein